MYIFYMYIYIYIYIYIYTIYIYIYLNPMIYLHNSTAVPAPSLHLGFSRVFPGAPAALKRCSGRVER